MLFCAVIKPYRNVPFHSLNITACNAFHILSLVLLPSDPFCPCLILSGGFYSEHYGIYGIRTLMRCCVNGVKRWWINTVRREEVAVCGIRFSKLCLCFLFPNPDFGGVLILVAVAFCVSFPCDPGYHCVASLSVYVIRLFMMGTTSFLCVKHNIPVPTHSLLHCFPCVLFFCFIAVKR
ncbi:hypothetical protein Tb927.7.6140 [Trypanosoma brucei brucei TREU927]|uniref:T. brucei spp.-specific protein n=1 Tax=Trypanosoma brucei brucei (strain 927/4 GUTat10.1) TaxID=185431 RepID=Q57VJ7_TRYB2|nr:hypothetical protein Tb927.7.6140 [Trypanosoma brucei brucei TREU927]AAX70372.1 hypothetical protein Tb927.7.6140 [Trypanosoma brucei]AAZ12678.1 hypothetical protein Tb927.7.6140 [Trypanosoma brucei brucei TREU927]